MTDSIDSVAHEIMPDPDKMGGADDAYFRQNAARVAVGLVLGPIYGPDGQLRGVARIPRPRAPESPVISGDAEQAAAIYREHGGNEAQPEQLIDRQL